MLFKRRDRERAFTRLRIMFWPRRNHMRSTRYYWKRVLRIRAKPHAIALGVAAGAFASFTPFMGFHFILSFLIAFLLRGSMIAAALGTAVGNPLTFPAIWASTLGLGRIFLGRGDTPAQAEGFMEALKHGGFKSIWDPFIVPMLAGGIPLGLVAGVFFYFLTRGAARAFQATRLQRQEARAKARLDADTMAVRENGAAQ